MRAGAGCFLGELGFGDRRSWRPWVAESQAHESRGACRLQLLRSCAGSWRGGPFPCGGPRWGQTATARPLSFTHEQRSILNQFPSAEPAQRKPPLTFPRKKVKGQEDLRTVMTLGRGILLNNRCFQAFLIYNSLQHVTKLWPGLGNASLFRSLPPPGLTRF